eukprot:TRINITY_DN19730_c0_g1_i1.p1 TRINITY_DN19730_c0_g1~~TRINITY_DN19730_c0_g1_i1.p1  ORF type:complete len:298 (-),score=76.75 TRINITY_DN19730_c0_g1_i1:18-911(-)
MGKESSEEKRLLSIDESEGALLAQLAEDVQAEMMVELLAAVQQTASVCAKVCVRRMERLRNELLHAFAEEQQSSLEQEVKACLETSPSSPRRQRLEQLALVSEWRALESEQISSALKGGLSSRAGVIQLYDDSDKEGETPFNGRCDADPPASVSESRMPLMPVPRPCLPAGGRSADSVTSNSGASGERSHERRLCSSTAASSAASSPVQAKQDSHNVMREKLARRRHMVTPDDNMQGPDRRELETSQVKELSPGQDMSLVWQFWRMVDRRRSTASDQRNHLSLDEFLGSDQSSTLTS